MGKCVRVPWSRSSEHFEVTVDRSVGRDKCMKVHIRKRRRVPGVIDKVYVQQRHKALLSHAMRISTKRQQRCKGLWARNHCSALNKTPRRTTGGRVSHFSHCTIGRVHLQKTMPTGITTSLSEADATFNIASGYWSLTTQIFAQHKASKIIFLTRATSAERPISYPTA